MGSLPVEIARDAIPRKGSVVVAGIRVGRRQPARRACPQGGGGSRVKGDGRQAVIGEADAEGALEA